MDEHGAAARQHEAIHVAVAYALAVPIEHVVCHEHGGGVTVPVQPSVDTDTPTMRDHATRWQAARIAPMYYGGLVAVGGCRDADEATRVENANPGITKRAELLLDSVRHTEEYSVARRMTEQKLWPHEQRGLPLFGDKLYAAIDEELHPTEKGTLT
jgi:hypothetical protein